MIQNCYGIDLKHLFSPPEPDDKAFRNCRYEVLIYSGSPK